MKIYISRSTEREKKKKERGDKRAEEGKEDRQRGRDKGTVIQKLFHVQMYILRTVTAIERHVCASYDALKPVIGRKKGETDRCNLAPSRDLRWRKYRGQIGSDWFMVISNLAFEF